MNKKSNMTKNGIDTTAVDDDNKDRPLTRNEVINLYLKSIMIYVVVGPMLLVGAYVHTYPQLPKPWFGFWVYITTLVGCVVTAVTLLLDCPRIIRERMNKHRPNNSSKNSNTKTDKDGGNESSKDAPNERLFYNMSSICCLVAIIVMPYDAIQRSDVYPRHLNYVGAIIMYLSYFWMIIVLRTNQYASKIVYKNENHQLVT